MKKYTIVSFVLLTSLFGTPLYGGESSGGASSSAAAVGSAKQDDFLDDAVISYLRVMFDSMAECARILREYKDVLPETEAEAGIIGDLERTSDEFLGHISALEAVETSEQLKDNLKTCILYLRSIVHLLKSENISDEFVRNVLKCAKISVLNQIEILANMFDISIAQMAQEALLSEKEASGEGTDMSMQSPLESDSDASSDQDEGVMPRQKKRHVRH